MEAHITTDRHKDNPDLVALAADPILPRPRRSVADRNQMREIGIRLRWVREAYGKSQASMAPLIGVSQSAWSLYERGLRMPDHFEVVRIAGRLGITIDYLLFGNLSGVQPGLAIYLRERHPEFFGPTSMARDTGKRIA